MEDFGSFSPKEEKIPSVQEDKPAASVADILDRAADLIEPEGAWTRGVFARNAAGEDTGLSQHKGAAVCWCLLGAIDRVAEDDRLDYGATEAMRGLLGGDLSDWNDAPGRTQAEVVAALRQAAERARALGEQA